MDDVLNELKNLKLEVGDRPRLHSLDEVVDSHQQMGIAPQVPSGIARPYRPPDYQMLGDGGGLRDCIGWCICRAKY